MTDKEVKSFTLDPENKRALDQTDNASAVVNDLVTQWRQGGKNRDTVALELRKRQKERQIEEAQDKLERLQTEDEEIERLLIEFECDEDAKLEEARNALANTPKDPNNGAVENWAQKLGVTPEQLIDSL